MDDADLDLAVEGALFSGFGTAGQRCTSLGTVIVARARPRRVHGALQGRASRAPRSATRPQDVLYGPMIHERFLSASRMSGSASSATTTASTARRRPGRITADNPREGFVGDDPDAGLFVHPTIVDGVRADDDLANTETFGPLVGVASFGDFDEAMALANGHGYGLSASIYTTSPKHAFRFRERIGAGMVSVNNSTSGAEAHLPFGGNGRSGNGSRQSGMWVLDQFTRWQAINWDYAASCRRPRWTSPRSTRTWTTGSRTSRFRRPQGAGRSRPA